MSEVIKICSECEVERFDDPTGERDEECLVVQWCIEKSRAEKAEEEVERLRSGYEQIRSKLIPDLSDEYLQGYLEEVCEEMLARRTER